MLIYLTHNIKIQKPNQRTSSPTKASLPTRNNDIKHSKIPIYVKNPNGSFLYNKKKIDQGKSIYSPNNLLTRLRTLSFSGSKSKQLVKLKRKINTRVYHKDDLWRVSQEQQGKLHYDHQLILEYLQQSKIKRVHKLV